MSEITAKNIVSHWELIKSLMYQREIYVDFEVSIIDQYINQQLLKEINNAT